MSALFLRGESCWNGSDFRESPATHDARRARTLPMALQHILILSSILFFMGLLGVLTRRSAIMTLASLEIMINAACLNFVAFWRFRPFTDSSLGLLFSLFAIAVAAAEAAVGLALVIALYRHYKSVNVEKFRGCTEAPETSLAAATAPAPAPVPAPEVAAPEVASSASRADASATHPSTSTQA